MAGENNSWKVGVETPSNNINARTMSYDPALFLGNVANAVLIQVQLANYTGGVTGTNGYVKGLAMAQFTSGANAGKYVNWVASGANGQGTCVGFLCDDRIPYYEYGSTTLPFRTPGVNDRFTIAFGQSQLFLAALSATGTGGAADVLAALATLIGARTYNNTVAYIP